LSAVFLDTVGVLALLDVRDQWHAAAEGAWARVLAEGADFLTTSLVLVAGDDLPVSPLPAVAA
jgi:predicted nucleic acid-binding protein